MTTRTLSPNMHRALGIRIAALEAEQRADAEEIERLDERLTELLYGMLERQQTVRMFREILLNACNDAGDEGLRDAA